MEGIWLDEGVSTVAAGPGFRGGAVVALCDCDFCSYLINHVNIADRFLHFEKRGVRSVLGLLLE